MNSIDAALTMIEELDDLSPETLGVAYKQANEWLAESQSKVNGWQNRRVKTCCEG
jgi:hypothetical protein